MNNLFFAIMIFTGLQNTEIGIKISIDGVIFPSFSVSYYLDNKNGIELSLTGAPVQGSFIFRYEINYVFRNTTNGNFFPYIKAGIGHMGGEGKHILDFHPEPGIVFSRWNRTRLYLGLENLFIFKRFGTQRKTIRFVPMINFSGMYGL